MSNYLEAPNDELALAEHAATPVIVECTSGRRNEWSGRQNAWDDSSQSLGNGEADED